MLLQSFIAQMREIIDELIVILAGYSRHMQALLSSNPGFKSRIEKRFIFLFDYSEEEPLEIFKYMVHRGMTIDDEASCA